MFITRQTGKIYFVYCNWFVLAQMLLANSDELKLIPPKSARPLNFSFLVRLFGTSIYK